MWAMVLAGCEASVDQPADQAETQEPSRGITAIASGEGSDAAASSEPSAGSQTWHIYRGDAALRGVAAGSLPGADELELLWSFETGGAIVSSPVVAEGKVYIGSDDGHLYCIDFETGEKIWSYPTEFIIEAPPLVHDGIVYVGSHDFYLHAVDAATGEGLWKFETYEKIVGSANVVPVSMRGVPHPGPLPGGEGESQSPDPGPLPGGEGAGADWIVIGSHDAFVYALDAKTGEKMWECETRDRVNGTVAIVEGTGASADGTAIVGGRIVFGGCDTILYSVDAVTGGLTPLIELGGECHIAASVAVDGEKVFLGHNANEIVCFDLAANEIVWRYGNSRFGFFAAPAVTDKLVIVGGRDSKLHAIDKLTGEPVWAFTVRRKIESSPVVCGDRVVVGSGDGRLYIVNLEDGSEVWSYDVGKSIFSSPAVVNGRILVGSNDHRLYAFGEDTEDSSQETDGD